jgi:hypothetical protein
MPSVKVVARMGPPQDVLALEFLKRFVGWREAALLKAPGLRETSLEKGGRLLGRQAQGVL